MITNQIQIYTMAIKTSKSAHFDGLCQEICDHLHTDGNFHHYSVILPTGAKQWFEKDCFRNQLRGYVQEDAISPRRGRCL